jgi:hypothetical protein
MTDKRYNVLPMNANNLQLPGVRPLGRGYQASDVVKGEVARLVSLSRLVGDHGPVTNSFHAARYRYLHAVLHRQPPYKFG